MVGTLFKLFELLTEYAGKATPLGELELAGESPPINFTMLMEESWKQSLLEKGIR